MIIESDDWGSIRMRSSEAFRYLKNKGYEVDRCIYNTYDCLESNADLEYLFEALASVKDSCGKSAVFTANNIVANPDFQMIRDSEFCAYCYEPFSRTLEAYPNHDKVLKLYQEGISSQLFVPQFHGREHVNVNRWLADLRLGKKGLVDAFDLGMFSLHESGRSEARREYLDAFGLGYSANDEIETMESIVESGLALFEQLCGFRSRSFIAPTYTWPTSLEACLQKHGVSYLQGNYVQKEPVAGGKLEFRKKYHYIGQINKRNQIYLVRNVFFEPAESEHVDWVDRSLAQVDFAFKIGKPAIVSSHRVNYVGSLSEGNRNRNLKLLCDFLRKAKKRWPEIEFMTSEQLGSLILDH